MGLLTYTVKASTLHSMSSLFIGIACMQVLTGSLNTIFVKLADEERSLDSEDYNSWFNHPFLQAASMFLGEMCCMLVYFAYSAIKKAEVEEPAEGVIKFRNPRHGYLFIIPAMCDMVATSLMYVGLTMTSASSFQIFRGSLIIFTGLLTVVWLRKRLEWFRWLGMFVILCGLAITGVGDLSTPAECLSTNITDFPSQNLTSLEYFHTKRHINVGTGTFGATLTTDDEECTDGGAGAGLLGNVLIVGAQVVMAFQGVYEEEILVNYDVNPLLAVGWEGFFGFSMMSILLVPFGYWKVGDPWTTWSHGPHGYFEDTIDAFTQLGNNNRLLAWFICTIFSIGFFNFAGMLVTKKMSATTRTVLDSVRTVVVWVCSITLGWELFTPQSLAVKVVGFLVVVSGVFLFNNILFVPMARKCLNKEK